MRRARSSLRAPTVTGRLSSLLDVRHRTDQVRAHPSTTAEVWAAMREHAPAETFRSFAASAAIFGFVNDHAVFTELAATCDTHRFSRSEIDGEQPS